MLTSERTKTCLLRRLKSHGSYAKTLRRGSLHWSRRPILQTRCSLSPWVIETKTWLSQSHQLVSLDSVSFGRQDVGNAVLRMLIQMSNDGAGWTGAWASSHCQLPFTRKTLGAVEKAFPHELQIHQCGLQPTLLNRKRSLQFPTGAAVRIVSLKSLPLGSCVLSPPDSISFLAAALSQKAAWPFQ